MNPVCEKTVSLAKIKVQTLIIVFFVACYTVNLSGQEDANKTAWDLANKGQLKQAIDYISNSIEQNPQNPKYLNSRAYFYFMSNSYSLSLDDCNDYVSRFPGNSDVYMLMGDIYSLKGKYLEAIDAYTSAKEFSRSMSYKQYSVMKRSSAYNKIALYEKAMEDLKEANSIFSNDSVFLYNLAYAQFHLGLPNEAIATLNLLLEQYPEYPDTYAFYADIYKDKGQYAKALSMLKKHTWLTIASIEHYDMLYSLALQQKDSLTAIIAIEDKIKHYNVGFNDELLLARMYFTIGDLTKAAAAIERVSEKWPEQALAYKIKGDIHWGKDNKDLACDCYFLALQKGYLDNCNDSLLQQYIDACE